MTDKCGICGEPLPSDDSDRTPVVHMSGRTMHETCYEQRVERQQVEQVFGLTGGELSDESWSHVYEDSSLSTDREPVRDDHGRTAVAGDARIGAFRYWYEGAPEYVASEYRDQDARTAVTCALFGMPPEVLWDAATGYRWRRAAFYQSSGETECPGCALPSVTRREAKLTAKWGALGQSGIKPGWFKRRAECPLCGERIGEPHGCIYLGDGWGEAVYVRETPRVHFEVIDHGVEHEQYFAGCGVVFTPYTDVATGAGDSARDAGDDALEQVACGGLDEIPEDMEEAIRALPSRSDAHEGCPDDDEECGRWHYVSVRWRVER